MVLRRTSVLVLVGLVFFRMTSMLSLGVLLAVSGVYVGTGLPEVFR